MNYCIFNAAWLLLFALTCPCALGHPVHDHATRSSTAEMCLSNSMSLLSHLRGLLEDVSDAEKKTAVDLFRGFNCTELAVEVNPNTQTVTVCQPNESSDTRCYRKNNSFQEMECLRNIKDDLLYYEAMLIAYDNANLNAIKRETQSLLKNCPLLPSDGKSSTSSVCVSDDAFDNRKCLCKVLKGFHLRVITITRALGYVAAERKK